MQAPTYAELQTFKKVAAWLTYQAEALARKPDPRPIPLGGWKRNDNPLEIFDRFPNGAKLRTLEAGSRAFRRLMVELHAGTTTFEERIERWAEVGVLATLVRSKNGLFLRLIG